MTEHEDGTPSIVEEHLKRPITLRDLQLSDPFNRTLAVPLIVRSKRNTSKYSDAPAIRKLNSPIAKRDVEYITTFTPEYSYEVKANDPEGLHDRVYVERSVTGAWIRLLRDINNKMGEDASVAPRRANQPFKDFCGLNSVLVSSIFAEMKKSDFGEDPESIVPPSNGTPIDDIVENVDWVGVISGWIPRENGSQSKAKPRIRKRKDPEIDKEANDLEPNIKERKKEKRAEKSRKVGDVAGAVDSGNQDSNRDGEATEETKQPFRMRLINPLHMSGTSRTYTQDREDDRARGVNSINEEGMDIDGGDSEDDGFGEDPAAERPSLSSLLGDQRGTLGDETRPRAGTLVLLTSSGLATRTRFPLREGYNVVGREPPDGEVKLTSPHVTSKHAIIDGRGGARLGPARQASELSVASPSQLDEHRVFGQSLRIAPSTRTRTNRYQIPAGVVLRFADVMCRFEVAAGWKSRLDMEMDAWREIAAPRLNFDGGDDDGTCFAGSILHIESPTELAQQAEFLVSDSQELFSTSERRDTVHMTVQRSVQRALIDTLPNSKQPPQPKQPQIEDEDDEPKPAWSQDLVDEGDNGTAAALPQISEDGAPHIEPRGHGKRGYRRGRGRSQRSQRSQQSVANPAAPAGSDTEAEGEEEIAEAKITEAGQDASKLLKPAPLVQSLESEPAQRSTRRKMSRSPPPNVEGEGDSDTSESMLARSRRRPDKRAKSGDASVPIPAELDSVKERDTIQRSSFSGINKDADVATKKTYERGKVKGKGRVPPEIEETVDNSEIKLELEPKVRPEVSAQGGETASRGRARRSVESQTRKPENVDGTPGEDELESAGVLGTVESENLIRTRVGSTKVAGRRGRAMATAPKEVDVKESENSDGEPAGAKRKRELAVDSVLEVEMGESTTSTKAKKKPKTSGVAQTAKVKVVFSGLPSPDDKEAIKLVHFLKFETVDTVKKATHLVTDIKLKRTVKFFSALSEGKPIVSIRWLQECKRKGEVVDTGPFILQDASCESKWGFELTKSLAVASEREEKLLVGREFFITPNVKPGDGDINQIVECAGGKVLKTIPTKNFAPGVVVLGCEEDLARCAELAAKGYPVYTNEFVLTGILRQEVDENGFKLDLGDHELHGSSESNGNGKHKKQSRQLHRKLT
ncbi:Mediator of DNA damage checkpoint protein 1 [Gonapodya sp. JEL0774]|nr:Mediator of DNA damage checkpoint protein 1 [Gonapodya sp. JEL0774]